MNDSKGLDDRGDEFRVGLVGIVAVSTTLVVLAILVIYGLIRFWPVGDDNGSVTFLFWDGMISAEARLLLIVVFAGLLHVTRSFYWYVGNRLLVSSWLMMYLLTPVVSAAMALVFYFVVRGGFFAPGAKPEQTSPFGFAALAALIGMFSEQAVLKLKKIAETLLGEVPPGADSKPQ